MDRKLYKELLAWKEHLSRLPLLLRGARQVGKSYLIESFGKKEFKYIHVVNFEKKPKLSSCFESLDPIEILKELELLTGVRVQPGLTLLFFDEIQDCPQALKALRYFAEEMPELHVIAAGSLLEFILEDNDFSFPVGRVQFINLGPLSFAEYLNARKEFSLLEFIQSVRQGDKISKAVHQRLLDFAREFFIVGGMPGVVHTFIETGSYVEAQRRQAAILDLYTLDFGKYSSRFTEHRHIKKLFERAPNLAGKHFKFSKIDPNSANPARDYQAALDRLKQARLIVSVHYTHGNGLPLKAEKNEKKFKIFLLDLGLLGFGLGSEHNDSKSGERSALFRGVMAEQFVAQEFRALQDPYIEKDLYFWENLKPSSSAEIDFLLNLDGQMIAIEVKSGPAGRLKSLRQFMEAKSCPFGVRISEHPLAFENDILSIPFYLIGELPRLLP